MSLWSFLLLLSVQVGMVEPFTDAIFHVAPVLVILLSHLEQCECLKGSSCVFVWIAIYLSSSVFPTLVISWLQFRKGFLSPAN